ncbi:MAG TPA: MarR family transcriptional regulator [Gammaproteobacteria bacterium]
MRESANPRRSRRLGGLAEQPAANLVRNPARGASRVAQRQGREVRLGSLANQIGYALRRAQLAVFADLIDALAKFDLTPAKFSVLAVIHENPGVRPSEVGRALDIKKTNFVPLLDSLERRGLVVRRPAAEDRRAVELHLTAEGRALLQRANQAQARHETKFVARLGERGRTELLELLERLTTDHDAANCVGSKPSGKGKR